MKYNIITILVLFSLITYSQNQKDDYAKYADPFIGTGGHGHTFPGATLPFGMVQLSPDTDIRGWDWCSGYHNSDSSIMGFSHTHLSGTGGADYGDIMVMPFTGEIKTKAGSKENPDEGYRSGFSHENEISSPGYYSVFLDDYKIKAELTATTRTGFHRYTFPQSEESHFIFDLEHGIHDRCSDSKIEVIDNHTIEGFRRSTGWADDHTIYFIAEFSKPFSSYKIFKDNVEQTGNESADSKNLKIVLNYSTDKEEQILVKVGISHTSLEGARKNLHQELSDWNFDKVKEDAYKTWNSFLSKIKAKGGTEKQKRIFYTALYHTMIAPNVMMDVDGSYIGMDKQIHKADDFEMYTVFSLWDTFRAAHPLYSIILPEYNKDFVKSLLQKYKETKPLPVWELASNETWTMIGYPSIPVIVDAYMKGETKGIDLKEIFKALKNSAMDSIRGLKYYNQYGFIPANKDGESVSTTLEYAYDDWCIAQIAKTLGYKDEYSRFIERAQNYKNYFDDETKFFRPISNGDWELPFNPFSVSGDYTEANAWQYLFFVPQDVSGMIKLLGGKEKFSDKLDQLFTASSNLAGLDLPDITGLIGQYAHGNEPSHHISYLYNFCGKPWKTQEKVRYIIDNLYDDKPNGLSGNEDCGQMSAWYVLSAMGFYPVTPGTNEYIIGTPIFDKVAIDLGNGKTFTIEAKNVSDKNFYISSAKLKGKEYNKTFFTHDELISGGSLVFEMSSFPNKEWSIEDADMPVTKIKDDLILPVPIIKSNGISFTDSTKIEITARDGNTTVYYTTDGSEPNLNSPVYSEPFTIKQNTTVKAFAEKDGFVKSNMNVAQFIKAPSGRSVKYLMHYDEKYTAGGDKGLIDMIRGPENFRTGEWQGFQGEDMDVIIDLGKEQDIGHISAGFLQDIGSWIFFPENVQYLFSTDGHNYSEPVSVENKISHHEGGTILQEFKLDKEIKTRFIKVIAKNIGMIPDWHNAAGHKAWIFSDEIIIN